MTLQHSEYSWRGYLTSQGIVSADDELLLDVFQSSLRGAPLPAPWSMWHDKQSSSLFFTNSSTGETSWTHPLNSLLLDLAGVAQRFLALPFASRAEHLAALNRTWEAEARAEILRWRSAYDNGAEYFYNVETKAAMWERPVDALLPAFYLKKQYLRNLSAHCSNASSHKERSEVAHGDRPGQEGGGYGLRPSLPLIEQSHMSVSWESYLSKEILKLPDDEELLQVFQAVLKGAPLPAPWSMWCDKGAKTLFFTNAATRETSWTHPLHDVFVSLADVGRRFFTLPFATRAEHLVALNKTWDTEARAEILKWQAAYDEQDREYFFNVETKAVMWERPAEAVLPAFYLKKQFLKRLSLCKPAPIERRGSTSRERDRDSQSTMASTSNSSISSVSRMRKSRRSSRKLSNHALFDDNWEYYLTTQGIVDIPGEEMLLLTFQSVLKIAPLPAPWRIWNDKANSRFFFVQKSTGITSWQHPLNSVLLELAAVARYYLGLREQSRADHLAFLGSTWDGQAESEISKWKSALNEDDMEYFFNVETSETMWERPEDVVLPELFLKRQFLSKLSVAAEPSSEQGAPQKPQPPQPPEPSEPDEQSQSPQPPQPPEPPETPQPPEPPETVTKPNVDLPLIQPVPKAPVKVLKVQPVVGPKPAPPQTPMPKAPVEPRVQAKPPLPPAASHSPTRVKIKSISPKPARMGEAVKVTVVRKTARALSRDEAPKVTVISRDAAAHKGPTVTVRTMKEQASPEHDGNQLQVAKAAASAALAATTGTTIERLQAAAQAAYEAISTAAPDEHASTVQQALYEVVQQMQLPAPGGEACSTLAENAYFFARSVREALQGCSLNLPGADGSPAALAAAAAHRSGLSASWQVDAAIAAALGERFSGSSSPSFAASSQLCDVIKQVASECAAETETREAWLQKAAEKMTPLQQQKDMSKVRSSKGQELAATSDTWMMSSPEQVDSSPSGTETASVLGRTGRFSQTGSSKFAEFCNFRDVRRAMAEAENCLAAFEEERKNQRKALRRRSRNKLPTDILDAMGEAQRILSAFDEERRFQLQQLRVERAKSRANLP